MPALGSIRTRFAPTPSGFLHIGNAWSFLLTWLLARKNGGKIHLRIDDLDAARFRDEYLEDIFSSLRWLGLDWDSGPNSPAEFHSSFSQHQRRDKYRAALQVLMGLRNDAGNLVYSCRCSREKAKRDSSLMGLAGLYSGTCRSLGLPINVAQVWQSGKGIESRDKTLALRLHVPGDITVTLKKFGSDSNQAVILKPSEGMGDFILWQKNGEPSYQLASVVDDIELGINLVVRGRDLLPSSGVQAYIADLLGTKTYLNACYLHHGLCLGPGGEKMSKSSGSFPLSSNMTLKSFRERLGGREELLRFFAKALGLNQDYFEPANMLKDFNANALMEQDLDWMEFLPGPI